MSQATLIPTTAPSVILHNGRPATTSLEVAKFFGKQHTHVLRSIKDLCDNCPENFTASNFGLSEYTDETGRNLPMFTLHRDGFMLLVMGYTGKKAMQIKIAYIEAFNAMELALSQPSQELTPSTVADRKPLDNLVKVWCSRSGQVYAQAWAQVNSRFNLTTITELPKEWLPDALAFVQARIDTQALPAAPKESPLTPDELATLQEIELRLRKLHADVYSELEKVSELGFKLLGRRTQDVRILLPLYNLMKLEMRQAVVYDFHQVSNYLMPVKWLQEALPVFRVE